jgi:hypothetical protein
MERTVLFFRYKNSKSGVTGIDFIPLESCFDVQECYKKAYRIGKAIAELRGFDIVELYTAFTYELGEAWEQMMKLIFDYTLSDECSIGY